MPPYARQFSKVREISSRQNLVRSHDSGAFNKFRKRREISGFPYENPFNGVVNGTKPSISQSSTVQRKFYQFHFIDIHINHIFNGYILAYWFLRCSKNPSFQLIKTRYIGSVTTCIHYKNTFGSSLFISHERCIENNFHFLLNVYQ